MFKFSSVYDISDDDKQRRLFVHISPLNIETTTRSSPAYMIKLYDCSIMTIEDNKL